MNSKTLSNIKELVKRAGKPEDTYNLEQFEGFACALCLYVPPDGLFSFFGCSSGHDLCHKCMVGLQMPNPARINCYVCRAVVNRPANGWYPYPNNSKQDLLGHMQLPCCMDGCDARCTIAELPAHLEGHADQFIVECPLKCGWKGQQRHVDEHMEAVDHTRKVHKVLAQALSDISFLQQAIKTEHELTASRHTDIMEVVRAIAASSAGADSSGTRIISEMGLGGYSSDTVLCRLSDNVNDLKNDFDDFKRQLEPQLSERLTKVQKRAPDLAPDEGFPGGVKSSKMSERKQLRAWFGIPEGGRHAAGDGDWGPFEGWVHEHVARKAERGGTELRKPQDDGAPANWNKARSTERAADIDDHWYADTYDEAEKIIKAAKDHSRQIARSERTLGSSSGAHHDDSQSDY